MVSKSVALLAEGVDRNINKSAGTSAPAVALLAEGVDRNYFGQTNDKEYVRSPSSRRAWIEIRHRDQRGRSGIVALLAEGVDRNRWEAKVYEQGSGRPPRGGRG